MHACMCVCIVQFHATLKMKMWILIPRKYVRVEEGNDVPYAIGEGDEGKQQRFLRGQQGDWGTRKPMVSIIGCVSGRT